MTFRKEEDINQIFLTMCVLVIFPAPTLPLDHPDKRSKRPHIQLRTASAEVKSAQQTRRTGGREGRGAAHRDMEGREGGN